MFVIHYVYIYEDTSFPTGSCVYLIYINYEKRDHFEEKNILNHRKNRGPKKYTLKNITLKNILLF